MYRMELDKNVLVELLNKCNLFSHFLSFFLKKFYYGGDRVQSFMAAAFLMDARVLFSSSLILLAWMCVPMLFLMNFCTCLSLETLSSPTAHPSQRAKSHRSHMNLVCLVRHLKQRLCLLGHFVALIEAHGHGVAQSLGCCSLVAAAAQVFSHFQTLCKRVHSHTLQLNNKKYIGEGRNYLFEKQGSVLLGCGCY